MATPRSQLVDPEAPLHYHVVSRCVRRSWLCGRDRTTGRNYNHRKTWLQNRLFHLAKFFAVAIDAYAVMDNHFHLVVYFDPKESQRWHDSEVAFRWTEAFPPKTASQDAPEVDALKQIQRDALLSQPRRLQQARATLGSLSAFMKHLKQPIAWRANREDKCRGHFFEGRFYSGALLTEDAVVAAMAYVDLNPVRARIAKNIRQCRDNSIFARLQALASTPERLREALKPLVSGISHVSTQVSMRFEDYINYLELLTEPAQEPEDQEAVWFRRVASFKKRQRAYGPATTLKSLANKARMATYG